MSHSKKQTLISAVIIVLLGASIALLLGFGCSATLSISLTIIAEQGKNAAETAMISALSQCIGYGFSAIGPAVLGYLYDAFGKWEIILVILTVMAVGMTLLGLYAGRGDTRPSLS